MVVDVDEVLAGWRARARSRRSAGAARRTSVASSRPTVHGRSAGLRRQGRPHRGATGCPDLDGRFGLRLLLTAGAGRSASTSSRTAGATSTPNRWISAGSSPPTMKVLDPVGEGQLGEPLGPRRVVGGVDVVEPTDLDRVAARRDRGLVDAGVALGERVRRDVGLARQPAVADPAGELEHPRADRADPDLDVVRRAPGRGGRHGHACSARPRPAPTARSVSQAPRITSMPSSSARSASPGVRRGPPAASIASQKPPAPMPSSTRPRLSTSRLATVLASTNGGRSGRLLTLVVTRSVDGAGEDRRDQRPGVEEPRLVGMVLDVARSSPAASVSSASSTTRSGAAASGVRKVPNWRSWP